MDKCIFYWWPPIFFKNNHLREGMPFKYRGTLANSLSKLYKMEKISSCWWRKPIWQKIRGLWQKTSSSKSTCFLLSFYLKHFIFHHIFRLCGKPQCKNLLRPEKMTTLIWHKVFVCHHLSLPKPIVGLNLRLFLLDKPHIEFSSIPCIVYIWWIMQT